MQGKTIERISQLSYEVVDGVTWYPVKDVKEALQIIANTRALQYVDKADKRHKFVYKRSYRSYFEFYINEQGIRDLATKYAPKGVSVWEIMAALPRNKDDEREVDKLCLEQGLNVLMSEC